MSVLKIIAKNFLVHKDLDVTLDGESALVIGDSGTGKSAFLRILLAHTGQEDYPSDPLPDGEKEGFTQSTHRSQNGKVYTFTRTYVRREDGTVYLKRLEVRGPDGRKKSLEEVLDDAFPGVFTQNRFDYDTFFYKSLSFEARYKYFVKAIGGGKIEENQAKIEQLEAERAVIGRDRTVEEAVWEKTEYNLDTIEEDKERFSKERTIDEAAEAKKEFLDKNIRSVDALMEKRSAHRLAVSILNSHTDQRTQLHLDVANLQAQIKELQRQIAEKEEEIKTHTQTITEQEKFVLKPASLAALEKKINEAEEFNIHVKQQADDVYRNKVNEIIEFNTQKKSFFDGVSTFEKWEKLDEKWNQKDAEIKAVREDNEKILRELLPIPELSIGEHKGKPIVLYNGKELSRDKFSTGETIQITTAIQMALNPNADNMIIIKSAQNLGSKLREIKAACKKYKIQYLLEVTRPDEDFHIEIEEDSPVV